MTQPRRHHWGEAKRQNESAENHERRIGRRRLLEELRDRAEVVERDGRQFRVVRIPAESLASAAGHGAGPALAADASDPGSFLPGTAERAGTLDDC